VCAWVFMIVRGYVCVYVNVSPSMFVYKFDSVQVCMYACESMCVRV
jgi:hypothetical protein